MELGITGLPLTGKTTLFNALTGQSVATGGYTSVKETHRAVVKVPDHRLDMLAELLQREKKVPADVRYIDVAGIVKGTRKDTSSALLGALKTVDALIHVVRAFRSGTVPEPVGGINPERDIADLDLELALSDLEQAERRLERIEKELRSGKKEAEHECEVVKRCRDALSAEKPLRELGLSAEEEKLIRGFQFLTRKPMIIVINVGEDELDRVGEIGSRFAPFAERPHVEVAVLSAEIEMEVAQLDEADRPGLHPELRLQQTEERKRVATG